MPRLSSEIRGKIQKVILYAKSKRGSGQVVFSVNGFESPSEKIEGKRKEFKRPGNFHEIIFDYNSNAFKPTLEFILYDDIKFTKNDWRNRNRIKSPCGNQWLTIPIIRSHNQIIREAQIARYNWNVKHWKSLKQNYSKAPFFNETREFVEGLYLSPHSLYVSEVNAFFIKSICAYLGITTKISSCADYRYSGDASERLVELCKASGASVYLTGPAAKSYLDLALFKNNDIAVEWMIYRGYPEYQQRFDGFDHAVSILDLIFNLGDSAIRYIRRHPQQTQAKVSSQ